MNEEIKEANILKPSIEPKERWFKFFWSAKGTPIKWIKNKRSLKKQQSIN